VANETGKRVIPILQAAAKLAEQVATLDDNLGGLPDRLIGHLVEEEMLLVVKAVMESYPDGRHQLDDDIKQLGGK
jgi:hypothetical protein